MSEKSLEFIKRDDLSPVCPYCEKELNEVYTRSKGVPLIQGNQHCLFLSSLP